MRLNCTKFSCILIIFQLIEINVMKDLVYYNIMSYDTRHYILYQCTIDIEILYKKSGHMIDLLQSVTCLALRRYHFKCMIFVWKK